MSEQEPKMAEVLSTRSQVESRIARQVVEADVVRQREEVASKSRQTEPSPLDRATGKSLPLRNLKQSALVRHRRGALYEQAAQAASEPELKEYFGHQAAHDKEEEQVELIDHHALAYEEAQQLHPEWAKHHDGQAE